MQSASAIGLRHVLPVQTNKRIVPDIRVSIRSSTTPGRIMRQESASTRTTVETLPCRVGPSSMIMRSSVQPVRGAEVVATPLAPSCAFDRTSGPGESRSTSRTKGCAGTRSEMFPSGKISGRTSAGRRCASPWAPLPGKTSVTGPGHARRASRRPRGETCGTQSATSPGSRSSRVTGCDAPRLRSSRSRHRRRANALALSP